VTEADIPRLIAELGDESFAVRERAGELLRELGIVARPALSAAAAGRDPEVVHRARGLLEVISWVDKDDPEPVREILKEFHKAQPLTRRRLYIPRLASIVGEVGAEKVLPALVRILRFEDDDDVRLEALSAITRFSRGPVRAALEASLPPKPIFAADFAARAVMAWGRPDEAADLLGKAAAAEREARSRPRAGAAGGAGGAAATVPSGPPAKFLSRMLMRRHALLTTLGRDAEAGADLEEAARINPADRAARLRLLEWRIARGNWAEIDKAAEPAAVEKADAASLHLLAAAYAKRGQAEKAADLTAKALELSTDKTGHLVAAELAWRRGLPDAAEAECRRALEASGSDDGGDIAARLRLGEIAASRGRFAAAADEIARAATLLDAKAKSALGNYLLRGGSAAGLRARVQLYRYREAAAPAAADAATGAAADKALEALLPVAAEDVESAIAAVEALRARKRGPEADALVVKARAVLRKVITANPEAAGPANDLAWLLARVGRGPEEAADLAETAVALAPERASFWDTLAEVLSKRGDAAGAVEAARKAVELEPSDARFRARFKAFSEAVGGK
jgi:tetratricopeptide (TPR) repeat protein